MVNLYRLMYGQYGLYLIVPGYFSIYQVMSCYVGFGLVLSV
jgi:hypothetical protein